MTTEMGESLCCSWLKHIKRCQIVQTNWKTSFSWIHEELKLNVLTEAEDWFNKKYKFKKERDSTYRTMECDVLGVQFKKSIHKVYAVEVAFHRGNLHYKKNIEKVISKCLRIAICLRACFVNKTQIEIFFATPRMANKDFTVLKQAFETLNENYDSIDENVRFTLMAKDDFKNRVLKPLLIKKDQIADTSELFLRSCQMLEAAGMELDTTLTKDFLNDIEPISDIAWNYMVPILEKMKSKDITLLTKNGQLGISGWAVLSKKRNARRYYATPIIIEKEQYYLTNHWSEQNKDVLIQWILDHSK